MKTVVFASPYLPAPWIAAHGWRPLLLTPTAAGPPARGEWISGRCPWCRAYNDAVATSGADAVLWTTVCDQMRRMATLNLDHGPAAFLFNMPATWQTPVARRLYLSELHRLGIWLAERGGHAPDKEQLIQAFLQVELPVQPAPRVEAAPGIIRLALIGAPRLAEHRELETILARLGARLVLDATVSGLGGQPAPIDHRTLRADPLAAVAEAYFDAIPGLFRRPNSSYYTWLSRQLTAHSVHGFIALRYPWCDLRHAEMARLREWADWPMLDLEAGEDGRLDARALSRLQAFLELLQ